jgi:shikimate kinase
MSGRPVAADAPVFLVGFMGSGKTSVGSSLARRLGWSFVDIDAAVERAEGRPVEAIFRESGEGRFREAEWRELRALEGGRRAIIATGGGLFLSVAAREFVRRQGVSAWLDVPLEVAERRVAAGRARPLWPGADAVERRAMFERRRATYALADVRVDSSREGIDRVASAIEERLRTLWR